MRSKKEKSELVIGTDGNSYFQKGSIPNCVLESPVNLNNKELQSFKKTWKEAHFGILYGQSQLVEAFQYHKNLTAKETKEVVDYLNEKYFKPSDIPGLVFWLKAEPLISPLRKPYFRMIRPEVKNDKSSY